MNTYRIEMMTKNDFHVFMTGGYFYQVRKVDIEANTAEEAITIAENNYFDMVINKGFVRTVKELEAEAAEREAEREAFFKAEEERKARNKANREAREKAKAEALGLTVEEYKAKVKHDRKVRKLEEKIAYLAKELEEAKRELNKLVN